MVKKKFGEGCKSEHDAVYLETDSESFVLRRQKANPFNDPELKKWIAEKIGAAGNYH